MRSKEREKSYHGKRWSREGGDDLGEKKEERSGAAVL